jgi:NADH-quinone oxidoreductase subunit A
VRVALQDERAAEAPYVAIRPVAMETVFVSIRRPAKLRRTTPASLLLPGDPTMEYSGLLIFFLFSAMFGGLLWLVGAIFGPKVRTALKDQPVECGKPPFTLPGGHFDVKFYMVAILFVVFDVEMMFLFPWGTTFRELGLFGFAEMMIFLAVLVVGLAYAWKKGALDWE